MYIWVRGWGWEREVEGEKDYSMARWEFTFGERSSPSSSCSLIAGWKVSSVLGRVQLLASCPAMNIALDNYRAPCVRPREQSSSHGTRAYKWRSHTLTLPTPTEHLSMLWMHCVDTAATRPVITPYNPLTVSEGPLSCNVSKAITFMCICKNVCHLLSFPCVTFYFCPVFLGQHNCLSVFKMLYVSGSVQK